MRRAVSIFIVLSCLFLVCSAYGQQAQQTFVPKKVQVDTNYDGKIDRIEYYNEAGQVIKAESDPNGDGIMEEKVIYANGKPVRSERDTNGDGKPDIWVEF